MLGDDYEKFIEWSLKPLTKSIRINTLKVKDDIPESLKKLNLEEIEVDNCYKLKQYPFELEVTASDVLNRLQAQGWRIKRVPFYKYGFWLEHPERRDIGNTIEFQLGYYYSQEVASMIPPIVLDPQPGELILDMCAAPGSKTTQIAMHMENKGCVIANDIDLQRISALAENLQRQGVINAIVTKHGGTFFGKFKDTFDRVLLDAPCSGTGAIRKSYKTLEIWNPKTIKRLSKLQKSLILSAFDSVKPGGVLVYSTCSVEPEENEAVVNFLLEKRENAKVEKVKLPGLNRSEPFVEWNKEKFYDDIKKTLRIWPWDNDSEGFYVAKIRKT